MHLIQKGFATMMHGIKMLLWAPVQLLHKNSLALTVSSGASLCVCWGGGGTSLCVSFCAATHVFTFARIEPIIGNAGPAQHGRFPSGHAAAAFQQPAAQQAYRPTKQEPNTRPSSAAAFPFPQGQPAQQHPPQPSQQQALQQQHLIHQQQQQAQAEAAAAAAGAAATGLSTGPPWQPHPARTAAGWSSGWGFAPHSHPAPHPVGRPSPARGAQPPFPPTSAPVCSQRGCPAAAAAAGRCSSVWGVRQAKDPPALLHDKLPGEYQQVAGQEMSGPVCRPNAAAHCQGQGRSPARLGSSCVALRFHAEA